MTGRTYRIGEAARLLKLEGYVLRFWETEFEQLRPLRTPKGQRLYSDADLVVLRRIRTLLHEQGMTIEGARRVLERECAESGDGKARTSAEDMLRHVESELMALQALRKRSGLFFDVHLMIVEPENYLSEFQAAGADMLVVHAEATRHLQRTLAEIRRLGMKAGVALNPATPLSALEYVLEDVDMILLMSVNPGFGGQKFLPITYEKIRRLRRMLDERRLEALIQIDGGVTPDNTADLVRAGADVLVSGSAFFSVPPYEARRLAFESKAEEARSLTL